MYFRNSILINSHKYSLDIRSHVSTLVPTCGSVKSNIYLCIKSEWYAEASYHRINCMSWLFIVPIIPEFKSHFAFLPRHNVGHFRWACRSIKLTRIRNWYLIKQLQKDEIKVSHCGILIQNVKTGLILLIFFPCVVNFLIY